VTAAPYTRPRGVPSPSTSRLLLTLFALPSLAFLGTAIGLVVGLRGGKLTMLALALVTLCLGLVPLVLNQMRRPERRGIIFCMLSIWFTLLFVVPVFTNYIHMQGFAIPGSIGMSLALPDVVRGQWTALLGLCALLLGHYLPIGRHLAQAMRPPRRDWSHGVMLLVAMGMLVVGWTIYITSLLGLVPERAGSGFLGALGSGLIYANVLLTIAVWRYRSRLALLILAISVPFTSFVGFFGGSKEFFLVAPAMVGITLMTLSGRIYVHWIAAGLVALIVTYPTVMFVRNAILVDGQVTVLDAVRDLGSTTKRIQKFASSGSIADHLLEGFEAAGNRMDDLGVASVLIRDTPRVSPFQNGRTLGLFFIAFVPRVFWPDKPNTSTGRWITRTYTSSLAVDTWIAPSAIGDFYINYGYSAVFAGMLLLGLILRFADEALLARPRTAPMILAAVVILYKTAMGVEGNVGASWSTTVFFLLPIAATHIALRAMGWTIPIDRAPAARRAPYAVSAPADAAS